MRILVVEDDELISQSLTKALVDQHYTVDIAGDGALGWEFAQVCAYDLIVLDVVLPKLDGISLCRQIRSHGIKAPIILLTAQDSSDNKVIGLDAGADDYVTKPFDLQEISARIRALMRRGGVTLSPLLKWQNIHLDPSICEVSHNGVPIRLTPKEYSLLELFLRNPHRTFNSSAIIDHLWTFDETPGEDTVRAHLKGLRQKLKKAGVENDPIETVYGMGYRLKENGKEGKKQKKDKEVQDKAKLPESCGDENSKLQYTQEITNNIWERSQEKLSNRVAVLERATTTILQNTPDSELLARAYQDAHKLAGSLGMFGFDFGSHLASEIEQLFQVGASLSPEQQLHLSQLVVNLRRELQQASTNLTTKPPLDDEVPLVLVIGKDKSLAELTNSGSRLGMKYQLIADAISAREEITLNRPNAVVLDLSCDCSEDSWKLLAELNCTTPTIPVVVIAAEDSFKDRVKITRLGGRFFLNKPVEPAAIIEMVSKLLDKSRDTAAKILIVDDDTEVLTALSYLLQPWGLEISTLNNPLKFWDVLEETKPDLLILDVEMPEMNGIELCQVLRSDPQYSSIAVLFLTAHFNNDTMRRVFAAGADDYIRKPVVGPELVIRIFNRIERNRLLQNIAEIDPLTGLANRRKSTQEITKLLEEAKRYKQPLCFVILKIENLQQINHKHGYAIADQILSRCGKLLAQTFNNHVICRWAGAEFVVCLYSTVLDLVTNQLSECIKDTNQQIFNIYGSNQLEIIFSIGISQYPHDGLNLQHLYQTAASQLLPL